VIIPATAIYREEMNIVEFDVGTKRGVIDVYDHQL
jgi:hypothetical protein